jgi:hypothetical protein
MLGHLYHGKGVKFEQLDPLSAKNIMAMHQIYVVQVTGLHLCPCLGL